MNYKSACKQIITWPLSFLNIPLRQHASILMYHSVSNAPVFFTVSPAAFSQQMEYLSAKKKDIIFLSELVLRLSAGENVAGKIVLTFDDGYADNYDTVYPLLKKYGLPGSFFIITGDIGKNRTVRGQIFAMLSQEQIIEMHGSGLCEFFPHTVSHPDLTAVTDAVAAEEIFKSYEEINRLCPVKMKVFSYPRGKYNPGTIQLLKQQGFAGAVSVEEGLVSPGSNFFSLPRNSIDSTTAFHQFRLKISGTLSWYLVLQHAVY